MGAEHYPVAPHLSGPSIVCMICLLDKKKPYRYESHTHPLWERLRYRIATFRPVVIVKNWYWQRKNGAL